MSDQFTREMAIAEDLPNGVVYLADDSFSERTTMSRKDREDVLSYIAELRSQLAAVEAEKTRWYDNAVAERVRRVAAERERNEARREVDVMSAFIARQAALLTGVVNAIRGEPAPLSQHSHHDAVEFVQELVKVRYQRKPLPERGGYVCDTNGVIDTNTIATMREVSYLHDEAVSAVASLIRSHEALRHRAERAERDAERFALLATHVLADVAIGGVDVSEEACAMAASDNRDEVRDEDRISALRVAVDSVRLALESPPIPTLEDTP